MKEYKSYEGPLIGMLLAMVSGSIDSYTFLDRGGVFAGLQTGNNILMGISLSQLQFGKALQYVISILFFALGILIVKLIQQKIEQESIRKRVIIIYEITILLISGILAKVLPDMLIVGLLAIAASAQLQEFKMLKGNSFNPLMMTGNVSKTMNNLYATLKNKDNKSKGILIDTLMIMFSFILGSLLMGAVNNFANDFSILASVLPLVIVLFSIKE
ncbi:YoaK family protein [Lactobacillus sp. Sy-1]|uniref:YoaK family protein n=1 Tax=Lactobacillus sp. Sy-1 TaxID=2109645 RepID=UPI001C5A75B9|nr:YoaK family protein [Lactobacillus sp. Sy-1]MBW1606332.1 DUF1275 domain-containing protein [Lactobacillus sp. Sy-1]